MNSIKSIVDVDATWAASFVQPKKDWQPSERGSDDAE